MNNNKSKITVKKDGYTLDLSFPAGTLLVGEEEFWIKTLTNLTDAEGMQGGIVLPTGYQLEIDKDAETQ